MAVVEAVHHLQVEVHLRVEVRRRVEVHRVEVHRVPVVVVARTVVEAVVMALVVEAALPIRPVRVVVKAPTLPRAASLTAPICTH